MEEKNILFIYAHGNSYKEALVYIPPILNSYFYATYGNKANIYINKLYYKEKNTTLDNNTIINDISLSFNGLVIKGINDYNYISLSYFGLPICNFYNNINFKKLKNIKIPFNSSNDKNILYSIKKTRFYFLKDYTLKDIINSILIIFSIIRNKYKEEFYNINEIDTEDKENKLKKIIIFLLKAQKILDNDEITISNDKYNSILNNVNKSSIVKYIIKFINNYLYLVQLEKSIKPINNEMLKYNNYDTECRKILTEYKAEIPLSILLYNIKYTLINNHLTFNDKLELHIFACRGVSDKPIKYNYNIYENTIKKIKEENEKKQEEYNDNKTFNLLQNELLKQLPKKKRINLLKTPFKEIYIESGLLNINTIINDGYINSNIFVNYILFSISLIICVYNIYINEYKLDISRLNISNLESSYKKEDKHFYVKIKDCKLLFTNINLINYITLEELYKKAIYMMKQIFSYNINKIDLIEYTLLININLINNLNHLYQYLIYLKYIPRDKILFKDYIVNDFIHNLIQHIINLNITNNKIEDILILFSPILNNIYKYLTRKKKHILIYKKNIKKN